MLFEIAARKYMDDKAKRLRSCTLAGYESALALHVLPRWGGVELESIAPEDVQAWVDGFDLPGAAEKAYKTLRQVIRWAIRRLGVRMYDPTAAGVELPRKVAHRPRTAVHAPWLLLGPTAATWTTTTLPYASAHTLP